MDYHNADDQIKLANWAFSKGYSNHWTCWSENKLVDNQLTIKSPKVDNKLTQEQMIHLYHSLQAVSASLSP